MVVASVHVDMNLVRFDNTLMSQVGAQFGETNAMLQRITCPVLQISGGSFLVPGSMQTLRKEPSDRPNVKIVR